VRAAVWHAAGDLRVADVPVPEPAPDQALVRVLWCGLCGSDLEEYTEGPVVLPTRPHPTTGRMVPLVLGHEIVGVVERAAASGVGPPAGTLVVPDVVTGCGRCWWCQRHEEGLCPDLAVLGQHTDGGLAELVAARADRLVVVPSHVPAHHAALAEPIAVAVRAARAAGPLLGQGVLVIGGGTVGQLVTRVARAAGAGPVVVVDPVESRRALAARGGATAAVTPEDPVGAQFPPRGIDIVVEASGAPGQAARAVALARRGGRIVLLGVQPRPEEIDVLDIVLHEKTVRGSAAHMYDDDVEVGVGMLADGTLSVDGLVTHRIPLADVVEEGFERLRRRDPDALKVLVDCTERTGAA
jgi:(R,R)-butanediol dehydrogenase / meso-butanediol dehydrogenase / diacetyl reductase